MSKTSKKNKRGARGSQDDEIIAAKRVLTASVESMADEESEDEPTLTEIWNLLADVRKTVADILKDNKSLREEIAEMKSSIESQRREFSEVKESMASVKRENEALKSELQRIKEKLQEQTEESQNLWYYHDELEQYTRKNSLEITGIPESCYESTEEVVIKIAEVLNVDITPGDIEISHKLKRRDKTAIIVKFMNHKIKTKLYKERIKLKNIALTDLYPSYASSVNPERIYINENLTSRRRRLVGTANGMRKDNLLVSVWTIDGKVFVKTSPNGAPVRIYTNDDLDNL